MSCALVADLSLYDNLMLEPALEDGSRPTSMLAGLHALFAQAGAPIEWDAMASTMPQDADALAVLQVRVGRAMIADPDVLLVDADQWDDALVAPDEFTRGFLRQYPWRTLVWASADANRAHWLRESLLELAQ